MFAARLHVRRRTCRSGFPLCSAAGWLAALPEGLTTEIVDLARDHPPPHPLLPSPPFSATPPQRLTMQCRTMDAGADRFLPASAPIGQIPLQLQRQPGGVRCFGRLTSAMRLVHLRAKSQFGVPFCQTCADVYWRLADGGENVY